MNKRFQKFFRRFHYCYFARSFRRLPSTARLTNGNGGVKHYIYANYRLFDTLFNEFICARKCFANHSLSVLFAKSDRKLHLPLVFFLLLGAADLAVSMKVFVSMTSS